MDDSLSPSRLAGRCAQVLRVVAAPAASWRKRAARREYAKLHLHDKQQQDRPHRRRLGLLGRQPGRRAAAGALRRHRLPGVRLPRRDDDGDPGGARPKKPELGYATDFVDVAMRRCSPRSPRAGIKVVSNAGGIHPHGCAAALRRLVAERAWRCRIAVVEGDDVGAQCRRCASRRADMFSGDAAARAGAERQRLPRRAADRARRSPPAPTSSSPGAASTAR